MPQTIFDRIRRHDFHPLQADRRTFTVDRASGQAGVADPLDRDGRVRSLAVRDLLAAALERPAAVAAGLDDGDLHVRALAALALGVAGAIPASGALQARLRDDPEPLVRCYAAMALGEMGAADARDLLVAWCAEDGDADVRHQAELAAAQIAAGGAGGDAQRAAFRGMSEDGFGRPRAGDVAPDFALDDVEGRRWQLADARGSWQVLIWIFADWCPVCHREFAELMALREAFAEADVRVATLEAHDAWRGRLMVGREIQPALWGSRQWFREAYTERIWWPHLLDRAGAVGARYGSEPLAFAVHGEFVNRPTTVIVDPDGVVRLAYAGSFWGDRPSIEQTLDMIRSRDFGFAHPQRLAPPG